MSSLADRGLAVVAALLLAGCSSFHPWVNQPAQQAEFVAPVTTPTATRSLVAAVALSGGGARAAAFGLGVLRELKATSFTLQGEPTTLLDEVTLLSGVSGGSILAAHYAAFGDESLTRFESDFLLDDFEGTLVQLAFSPLRLFRLSSPWYGRSNVLADRLDALYRGKTFADLKVRNSGLDLLITAADLTTGAPFEFTRRAVRLDLRRPGARAAVVRRGRIVGRAARADAHDAAQLRRPMQRAVARRGCDIGRRELPCPTPEAAPKVTGTPTRARTSTWSTAALWTISASAPCSTA